MDMKQFKDKVIAEERRRKALQVIGDPSDAPVQSLLTSIEGEPKDYPDTLDHIGVPTLGKR